MGIVSVELKSTSGTWELKQRSYSRLYQVAVDNYADNETAVLGAIPFVARSSHPHDSTARCIKIGPATRMDVNLWQVPVEFQTGVDSESNPLGRRAVPNWGTEKWENFVLKDLDDLPLLNTLHYPFDQTPPIIVARPTLEITRFEAAPFDPDILETYVGRVNSGAFYGKAAHFALCDSITSTEVNENDTYYASVTYRFIFNSCVETEGWWKTLILNSGYYQAGLLDLPERILIGEIPISVPSLLDVDSHVVPTGDAPYYQTFRFVDEVDFADLGLE